MRENDFEKAGKTMIRARVVWSGITLTLLLLLACGRGSGGESNVVKDQETGTERRDTPMSKAEQDKRIDYLEFRTTDMNATKQFYAAVFGWTFTDYGPDYASFNDGRLDGGFVVADEVGTGGPLCVFYAIDLEGIESVIKAHGGQILRETFEFPGGRRFHFRDPSGNELAVWTDR